MNYKYFVTSDVHNYGSLLKLRLKENGFDINNPTHKVIVCGDAFIYGPDAGVMYDFLKNLKEKDKLIYIYGNHDIDLLNDINSGSFKPLNRKTVIDILKHNNIVTDNVPDSQLSKLCKQINLESFIKETTIPYFETEHYIFVHGYIPTKKHKYISNWRNSNVKDFINATRSDAMMLNFKYNIKEPNKIIVAGHFSAARANLMVNATKQDWDNKIYKNVSKLPLTYFKTFISDSLIILDGSTNKTGTINIITISE